MIKTWKSVENRFAKIFGTRRTPLSGINSEHTGSDTLHQTIFFELKHGRASLIETMWKRWQKDTILLLKIRDPLSFYPWQEPLAVIHTDNLVKVANRIITIKRKNFAAARLYWDTEIKAKAEAIEQDRKRLPVVVLHKLGQHGFLLLAKIKDYEYIKEQYRVANN